MKKITLLLNIFLFTCFSFSFAQREIRGKITDAKDGTPIAGATVRAKESNAVTVSNSDGSFLLNADAATKTIVVSFVGYAEREVPVSEGIINVSLTELSQALGEVVVVGYGTTTKRKLTGNIAKVKGEDIENMPVPNFTQALQGRAAGVFVESKSGKVGEGVKIRIRGAGSLTATNAPLYVIDGIPINSSSSYSGNPLADINFNDIESFDILKDAAAKAIYGSRGSNGVVIITTKKGRAGKTTFEANVQYGINRPTHLRDFLGTQQYVDLILEAANNRDDIDGIDYDDHDSYTWYMKNDFLPTLAGYTDWRSGGANVDWQKQAFNYNADTYSANISASGGTEKTKFYVSADYDNQDGIEIGNNFRRISARINLEQTVSDKFKLGFNLGLSQTTSARVPGDAEFTSPLAVVAFPGITPVRNRHGRLYNEPVTLYQNPLIDYENSHYNSVSYRNIGSIYGQYNFIPSLFFRSEFGVDILNQNDDSYYGPESYYGESSNGTGESDWHKTLVYNTNNYFTYKKVFAEKHDIEAILGMAYQYYSNDYANVTGEDFPSAQLQKLESAAVITGGTSFSEAKAVVSYFSRVNYAFNEKYLLSLSGRFDGSSVFGANNRYGFFPAVSAGWILSEEDFLKSSNILNYLKIRASYGVSGNDDLLYSISLNTFQGISYGNVSGLAPQQLGNVNLRWEKDQEFDVGIEFGFFKNRLSGEFDFYNRKTTDLLYDRKVPASSGFTRQIDNIGSMQNRGVELVLNSVNISSKNFRWNTSFNLAFNKNKLTKLNGEITILPSDNPRYLNSFVVGEGIGVFYGQKYAGVDPENGDALWYMPDGKTTTNKYNKAGYFVVGDPNPDAIAGLTNNFSFKGIELSVLFQGVFGNEAENGAAVFMTNGFSTYDNQTIETLDRWQKPGDITDVPQLRLRLINGEQASSRFVYDASYIRLKNVTLSYTLPASVTKHIGMQSLKVYVSGVNLLTFTDYPGWDPEVSTDSFAQTNRNQGRDFYSPPQIRNITFGLNIAF